eukprot:GILI01006912.1.p1 GENE.GILI01006912.1~~GILI01006912.1.p1  ORF type:complete len:758 (-),score=200.90 GILI01006912.1:92-2365(-)
MRFQVKQVSNKHTEVVSAVGWNANNELLSVADDNAVWRWSMEGEAVSKVCDIEKSAAIDLQWFPTAKGASDCFAVACTDGTFKLYSRSGRLEKSVEAHRGAVISLRWSYEGSALATGGEDGVVKVWSRQGNLRSTIAQPLKPVYCVVWSPDSDQILYASEKNICLKSLQAGQKQIQWKAHDGVVLKVDWNSVTNLIVSAGEDCKYKVWDSYGRQLFSSAPLEHVITSVAWSPNGELFAVGSFNMLRLCDKTGWSYSREKPESGSLMNIAWSVDGTQIAAAGGNGSVVFAHLVDRQLSWKNIEVRLDENNKVHVQDVLNETNEELDFRDRVIDMSIGFGYLVVVTALQCHIYNVQSWGAPHILELKDIVHLIVQSERHFALVDLFNGIQIFNYEGRMLSSPKFPGLRVECLNKASLSLSSDCVAVLDRGQSKLIRICDLTSGRPLGEPLEHSLDVLEVALSQCGAASDRKLCFVDKNKDLYVTPTHRHQPVKLAAMVDTVMWNDSCDMLTAVADGKLLTWYYPNVIYVDRDLLQLTRGQKDATEAGKLSQLLTFSGPICSLRRADGALMNLSVSPYPALLHSHTQASSWEKAIRLCRYVKDPTLWACLAAMAIHGRELNTAEIALAAIEEVDKVQFINHIKRIPTEQGRNAELALFCRRPDEAEQILLQAKLIYRAIKLNIRLFRWERALELAVQHKTHVDTVLGHRQRYLDSCGRQETIKRFQQYAQEVAVDWEVIKQKVQKEKEKEQSMPGARPYE